MHRLISGVSRTPFLYLPAAALLFAALPGCADRVRVASENYNNRISLVVIHHTAENFADSLGILTKRSANPVSSHYLIPEPDDPTYDRGRLEVYELVPERYRAWHAGESYWGGRTALNDQSIGIELVNRTHCHAGAPIASDPGQHVASEGDSQRSGDGVDAEPHANDLPSAMPNADATASAPIDETTAIPDLSPDTICFYPDFADSQIELLAGLLADILERYPGIKPTQIVGHSDIAPGRKIDPGPRFPWQRLYRLGFGAWYDDATVIRYWERFRRDPLPLRNVQLALEAYGYGIEATGRLDVQTRNVLRAFQMHFRPSETYGRVTTETVATLFALIEKYYPQQLDELLRVDTDIEAPAGPPAGGGSTP